MKSIAPFLVMIAILITITVLSRTFLNYKLKKHIIEFKEIDDRMVRLLEMLSGFETDALKWGVILFFCGLGLVVIEFIPYNSYDSSLPYGIELIFVAMGFICFFLIRKKEKNKI